MKCLFQRGGSAYQLGVSAWRVAAALEVMVAKIWQWRRSAAAKVGVMACQPANIMWRYSSMQCNGGPVYSNRSAVSLKNISRK
jgi:hypothetical protein